MPIDASQCSACGAAALEELGEYRRLPRITSDCIPFRDGGRLMVCASCGAAQSPADTQWFEEISGIYSAYRYYPQAGGVEQHVMDPQTGTLRRRSEVLLDRLDALPDFPRQGSVLDIGAGGGGTLRAFGSRGTWRLFGLEMDDRHLPSLCSIPGFDTLYTGEPRDLPGQFDVVTMVHALEHFPDPAQTLADLRTRIAPGGCLFVEAPDAAANPFEYIVADHLVHFTASTLAGLAARAGFSVDILAADWVPKELSMTARPAHGLAHQSAPSPAAEAVEGIRSQLDWLLHFVDAARAAASESRSFGLFGSAIAASWLCGVLGEAVSFFVEEDVNRVGRTHMERPILSPAQAPKGSVVFLALIPQIARLVAPRLAGLPLHLRMPPGKP